MVNMCSCEHVCHDAACAAQSLAFCRTAAASARPRGSGVSIDRQASPACALSPLQSSCRKATRAPRVAHLTRPQIQSRHTRDSDETRK